MYIKDKQTIWVATGDAPVYLVPRMANRHGLIAGATGTGKTITLKVLAESFSDMGVPVFLADVKGDVSGMCVPGEMTKHIQKSIDTMHLDNFKFAAYPTRFFDVYGKLGHPVRTTVSDMGPQLLARLLDLNDTQTGILNIIFKIADDKQLLLLDLKDLRGMVQYVGDNAAEFKTEYGNVSTQSIGTIQRSLLTLEDAGGNIFFGEPALDINDWMQCDTDGRGFLNLLECQELFQHPLLYSTFLLWMLSDLYEMLPEAGDLDKPKMVFFFDEAHLLFNDAPKALLDKVEQVVRLIRSKGIGVYFITQQPSDIPDTVLSQLGNRIQHALRAYTPNDQKALKSAAKSFRANPKFDAETVLTQLGTGEVLISLLDEDGVPTVVERANVLPPQSSMAAADPASIDHAIKASPLYSKYEQVVDRESAYEDLEKVSAQKQAEADAAAQEKAEADKEKEEQKEALAAARLEKAQAAAERAKHPVRRGKSALEKTVDSTLSTVGREFGRQLIRGLFGNLRR
ncbi:MAG: helicase HerA-like domain-containing protein [Ruthenibacterium sp.]